MKKLYLVRHAKSDWPEQTDDFDRPLSNRGHADAPKMAKYLKAQNISIDLFVTSTAKRALTTCRYFAEVFENKNILKCEELYQASPREFLEVIEGFKDHEEHIAVFSHNDGITHFANSLTQENIMHMPTCSVVAFEIDTEHWKDFKTADKSFLFFTTPNDLNTSL